MDQFDLWNKQKQIINKSKKVRFCKEREIWWCNLGLNIGHEENGKGHNFRRPVLILKKLSFNTALIVPLTKSLSRHHFKFKLGDSYALMSQIKVIDNRRCTKKIKRLDKETFTKIKKAIRDII